MGLVARRSAADWRLQGAVPDPRGSTVGADGGGLGLATNAASDVQGGAVAVVDPLAHPGVHEEEQSIALEHLASFALGPVGEGDIGRLMALYQVQDAKTRGK